MQIHTVQPHTSFRRAKRIGRGGKRGTTAGRGTKGQKARAGAKIRPAIRDIMKKLPKRRGYRFRSFQPKPIVLDLERLAERFPAGTTIDPAALLKMGLIRKMKGKALTVKVLGSATMKKQLHLRGIALSRPARARIEEAGGSVH